MAESYEMNHDPEKVDYKTAPAYNYEVPEHHHAPGDRKDSAVFEDGTIDVDAGEITSDIQLETTLQLVTKTLDITDDPTERWLTFRALFFGFGLAAFGAVIAEIFYFKPQTVNVNVIFLEIIAFVLGELTTLIPRWGPIGRFLNPGTFGQKEHVFITIMASSASVCALGTEQLAVQSLYYNESPNAASAIFMLLSSQMLGYGFLGGMRKLFVYPTKMLWPSQLPLASLFQSLHLDKQLAKRRLRIFWWVCGAIIIWEIIPEYIFPMLIGFSIFCLANQHSTVFTYLFGGANGDEGLGFLSMCFDWQYIGTPQLVLPLPTLVNQLIGYCGCIALTTAAYYANLWNAKTFPFMGQVLFTANGSVYNQSEILGDNHIVDQNKLTSYGVPWFTMSNALSLLVMNMAVTAGITHIFLWHWNDIKFLFTWMSPAALMAKHREAVETGRYKFWKGSTYVEKFPGTEGDPHFAAMRQYKDAPSWWYHFLFVAALAIGLGVTYQQKTQLPWWAFLVACLLSFVFLVFYAPLYAITGFYYQPVTAVQMIGGFMVPGRPVANMMFTLYGSNSMVQGLLMLSDLKLAQYAKLPPRATFMAQIMGTVTGAILNWVMMNSIVKNQRAILLSVEGSNIWSGQNVQTYNAQAIAWGGTSGRVFTNGGTYHMIPIMLAIGFFVPLPFYFAHKLWPKLKLNYINTFVISNWLGWLSVGINSSILPYFLTGFGAQWLRIKRPAFYAKYNMIVAAAIGGGVQIIIFVLTFAVFGGSGEAHQFPKWWGNNLDGNVDRCYYAG